MRRALGLAAKVSNVSSGASAGAQRWALTLCHVRALWAPCRVCRALGRPGKLSNNSRCQCDKQCHRVRVRNVRVAPQALHSLQGTEHVSYLRLRACDGLQLAVGCFRQTYLSLISVVFIALRFDGLLLTDSDNSDML